MGTTLGETMWPPASRFTRETYVSMGNARSTGEPQNHGMLTFVPAACFPGSCRKAYPKAFWHRGAPCSPRASRKFGLIYQGSQWILSCWIRARSRHSGSGTTLRGGLPCREPAGVSRMRWPSVIPWQHINLLGEYDFSDEKLRDSV